MEESATPTITQKRHTDFSVTFCFDSFVGRKIFPAQKNDAIRLKHIKITDKMNAVTQPHYDVATAIPPSVRILCSGFLDDENNISFDGYSCDATVSLREDESEDWSFASTSSLNKRRTSTKFNNDSGHEVNPAAVAVSSLRPVLMESEEFYCV